MDRKKKSDLLRRLAEDVEKGKCSEPMLRALLKPLTDNKKKPGGK